MDQDTGSPDHSDDQPIPIVPEYDPSPTPGSSRFGRIGLRLSLVPILAVLCQVVLQPG